MKKVLLLLLFFIPIIVKAQNIPYGNNPTAGNYAKAKDGTRIYYETYGTGKPLVLLHGGLYGEISEYENLIPVLSKNFMVIAIATRGHTKSEIGHQPYTYELMSDDAYTVIRQVTKDSITLIGFSDGAVIALDLTMRHPDLVKKLVFAGGNVSAASYRPGEMDELKRLSGASLERDMPDFVRERKKLMPEPERWGEFVQLLKHAWINQTTVMPEQIKHIKCPVLVAAGDRDRYNPIESFVSIYKLLPSAQLAIIPNSDHIIFYRQPALMETIVMGFVLK
ncbi:Pimeloyl-ACP methyl ester carboxylesterase [Mucilaginibacter gossypiicola]|uniref:Pimeloyl-ACP methyl ester carboxylesterase n=1 Tax=Mucilaginibacter gossypiicola TaxID=551995 RepID=A0A1H8K6T9_9SPHI|nr:alpha/beta hydrolase [Mucilaginibacter gossypiicola]SEN88555.1 Pimeloyl-ACP methyl ester carboxylesterase [Mucilaginibacter gossypiicola]